MPVESVDAHAQFVAGANGLGANGKSTTIDLWAYVLGDYSGTIGIETFLDQGIKKRGEQASPDLARLGGVRMLRASEPERGAKLNEALIKAATGGEPMAVRALESAEKGGAFDSDELKRLKDLNQELGHTFSHTTCPRCVSCRVVL